MGYDDDAITHKLGRIGVALERIAKALETLARGHQKACCEKYVAGYVGTDFDATRVFKLCTKPEGHAGPHGEG